MKQQFKKQKILSVEKINAIQINPKPDVFNLPELDELQQLVNKYRIKAEDAENLNCTLMSRIQCLEANQDTQQKRIANLEKVLVDDALKADAIDQLLIQDDPYCLVVVKEDGLQIIGEDQQIQDIVDGIL